MIIRTIKVLAKRALKGLAIALGLWLILAILFFIVLYLPSGKACASGAAAAAAAGAATAAAVSATTANHDKGKCK